MVLKKGKEEEDDLSQEPYPSPRFFTRPGEQVYLEALNVAVKKFQFHAYLTDQRFFLIDVVEKKVKATAKDIPLDSVEGCIVEVSPNQDPVLVLSLRQDDDEVKPLKITFVQKGTDRSAEMDSWVGVITGESPVPAHDEDDGYPEEEPEYEPEPEPEPAPRYQPPVPKSRPVVIPQPRQAPAPARSPEPRTRVVPQKEVSRAAPADYPVSREKPGTPRSGVQPQPARTYGIPQPVPRDAGSSGSTGRLPQQAPRVQSREPSQPGRKLEIDTTMKTAMRTAMQPLKQPPLQPLKHSPAEPLHERREKSLPQYQEPEPYEDLHEDGKPEGEGQAETIFCYNCGRKILRIANFCPTCGTRQTHHKDHEAKSTRHPVSPGSHSQGSPSRQAPSPRYEEENGDVEEEYPEERQSHQGSTQHKKPQKKTADSTILHKFLRK